LKKLQQKNMNEISIMNNIIRKEVKFLIHGRHGHLIVAISTETEFQGAGRERNGFRGSKFLE
jgi:hypothetical protein